MLTSPGGDESILWDQILDPRNISGAGVLTLMYRQAVAVDDPKVHLRMYVSFWEITNLALKRMLNW